MVARRRLSNELFSHPLLFSSIRAVALQWHITEMKSKMMESVKASGGKNSLLEIFKSSLEYIAGFGNHFRSGLSYHPLGAGT